MSPKLVFDPETQIPLLTGKKVFVTGGTAGIGAETVRALAKRKPAAVYFTGRSESSAEKLMEKIRKDGCDTPLHFIKLELSSLASVKDGAKKFLDIQKDSPGGGRLDILICNAGIMNIPASTSVDGYELEWATNHMGHALLIQLFLPLLRSTVSRPPIPGTESDVRIIILSSLAAAMTFGPMATFETRKEPNIATGFMSQKQNYMYSKLANLYYANELARREAGNGILTVTVHPGVVGTGLVENQGFLSRMVIKVTNPTLLTPEQGAWSQLWCVGTPRANGDGEQGVVNGKVYEPVGKVLAALTKGKYCKDADAAKKLYEWTDKELEGWLKD
ncbi:hypothetical protein MKZ38_008821 [Zalerion maritima]|uniref:Uncharacterized protein n=1 Tax=Zalerion maritima TaxID=339359 RepID=A0AAD5WVZ9_9PEZI|nr:hypothetical protein MKZ38_008821 [Zalerion maritima]